VENSARCRVIVAAEELEEDVVGSWVSDVLVFPSLARGEDVGETKCCLFCLATLRFKPLVFLGVPPWCSLVSLPGVPVV
jgi:hypothetical protein